MDLNVGSENSESIQPVVESVETVEVVSGTDNVLSPGGSETTSKLVASAQLSVPSSGMIEIDSHALTCTLVEMASQQLAQGNTILSSSLAASIPGSIMSVGGSSPLIAGMKRPIMSDSLIGDGLDDIPRKKSRNYLDSHKTIEKKRRDRINTGLGVLKEMVPDCRQYGTKKLDKAEIIEFTIEYIKRMQVQCNGRAGNLDLASSQREWANDIMTWVFQNKLLYTGSNALEQFCNALLLHLQSYGNILPASLNSPSNVLLNQGVGGSASSDEESLLRGQANFLQQLVSSAGQQTSNETSSTTVPSSKMENNSSNSNSTNHQQQIAQIQALLLLQQQQLLGQQGGQHHTSEGGGANNGAPPDESHTHQIQQLHQLQTLLLQHIASETGQQKQSTSSEQDMGVALSQSSTTGTASTVSNNDTLMVDPNITDTAITSAVELSLSSAITSGGEGLDHTPIYSSTSLEENLLVSTGTVQETSQMWSDHQQDSPLLLDSSVSVPEHSIENEAVQEEVELLSSQQDH